MNSIAANNVCFFDKKVQEIKSRKLDALQFQHKLDLMDIQSTREKVDAIEKDVLSTYHAEYRRINDEYNF